MGIIEASRAMRRWNMHYHGAPNSSSQGETIMRALIKLFDSLRHRGALLAIALLCAGIGLTHAQSTVDDGADPPSRVARLSWIAGDLGLLPAGASNWSDASVNRPLTTGDQLSSGDNARAEVELGGATLRLDHATDVGLLDLNEQLAQVELTRGTLTVSVRQLEDGQSYEIDTPTVALVIDQPGRFRVDIDGDTTRVTAFEGNATVYGENNAQRTVAAGRSYRFMDSGLATVAISDIGGEDNFDAWVDQRDQRYAQADSDPYVPDDMVGTPDLREYGAWENSSDYGPVWYPNDVDPDWAPYRDGRWAYIAPWGWTWIDAMPWGYAPYHYGRWAHTHRGWGWIPGPRYARPIYAPALVAFVGGGGFSVGIGSGPIGWFPLGPGEIYNPWYRSNRDYYRRINTSNIRLSRQITKVTINNRINNHYDHYRNNRPLQDHYVNRDAPRGFTAMSDREFAAGARVQRNLVKVDPRKLDDARVLPRGVRVNPAPGGLASGRSAHVRQLPSGGVRREVVARHAPPVLAQPRISAANERAGAAVPVSRVRVLDSRNERRPAPTVGISAERVQAPLPRPIKVRPSAPVVQRDASANDAPARNELRSARFAHPQNRDRVNGPMAAPRPGVSYIPSADQDSRQRMSRPALPQVPRIERADRSAPPAMIRAQPSPRDTVRQVPQRAPEPSRPEPRPERAEPARPDYVRSEARPQPTQREMPRPVMQQPRYEQPRAEQAQPRYQVQPQRVVPARTETQRPPRSEARPTPKPDPRHRDDGQQQ
jgi:hypothetical protein